MCFCIKLLAVRGAVVAAAGAPLALVGTALLPTTVGCFFRGVLLLNETIVVALRSGVLSTLVGTCKV